jgi:hypothetical protein
MTIFFTLEVQRQKLQITGVIREGFTRRGNVK